MTALVSLFIAMIPIDCKITNFSLHLYIYIYIYIMSRLTVVRCAASETIKCTPTNTCTATTVSYLCVAKVS